MIKATATRSVIDTDNSGKFGITTYVFKLKIFGLTIFQHHRTSDHCLKKDEINKNFGFNTRQI